MLGAALEGNVVTVLMPVRDTPARMLGQAVESILAQTHRDFEFLIFDDGSELTATLALLDGLRDPRVRVFHEPQRGLTPTLNRGLAMARGEFIARQDADDWSEPRRLELQVAFFEAHPHIGVCGTSAWAHQKDGARLWRMRLPVDSAETTAAFATRNPLVHGSAMFRSAAALTAGGYREEFICSQDYDFFWRLADRGGAVNLPEALYHYRYSGDAVSAHRAVEQAAAHLAARQLAAIRRVGGIEDIPSALARARQEVELSDGAFRASLKQADHLLLAGEYRGALRSYWRLLCEHPASLFAWAKLARWGVFRVSKCGFYS
jgi:glycosyltransferase involved in cell wall biosynthesis